MYQNALSTIENSLKKEREIKAIKHEICYYYIKRQNSNTFDLVNHNKTKSIYELKSNLFNSSFNHCLFGVETILTILDILFIF